MTHMDTDGGPQADFVGERGLMIDDWLLIIRKLIKLRKFLMDDYSKKLGKMFGGLELFE